MSRLRIGVIGLGGMGSNHAGYLHVAKYLALN